jgi:integrase
MVPRRCANTPGRGRNLVGGPDVADRTARVARPAGKHGAIDAAVTRRRLLAACDPEGLAETLRDSARLSEQSERRLLQLMLRFLRYLEHGYGITALSEVAAEHVRGFVLASSGGDEAMVPSVATSHLRRSAVRLLFRLLREASAVEHDPTLDVLLPPRSSLAARPLSDDEIALGRSFSSRTLGETRQPAAWALAEATARTSELSAIRNRDVDLDKARVWIPGSTKTDPRWGQLTGWGVETLARRIASLGASPDAALIYDAAGSGESRQASACAAISETLRRAGLAGEPDVRPVSVAAWAGARVLEQTGLIELAARVLGMRSLDRAARLVGWNWTPDRAEQ